MGTENLEVIKDTPVNRIAERIVKQTVELAESCGRAGPGANDTTSTAATEVANPTVEARTPGTAKHGAMTSSETSASSDKAGPPCTRANGTTSTAATTVEKSVGDAPELAKSCDEAGPSRSRANWDQCRRNSSLEVWW